MEKAASKRFWTSNFRQDVRQAVNACSTCQQLKAVRATPNREGKSAPTLPPEVLYRPSQTGLMGTTTTPMPDGLKMHRT